MNAVPSLTEIAADPKAVHGLPRDAVAQLRYQASLVVAACDLALARPEGRDVDRLVTAKEIAQRMGRSVEWVYANAAELPFTVAQEGKRPRFSLRGFDRWSERNQGRRSA